MMYNAQEIATNSCCLYLVRLPWPSTREKIYVGLVCGVWGVECGVWNGRGTIQ